MQDEVKQTTQDVARVESVRATASPSGGSTVAMGSTMGSRVAYPGWGGWGSVVGGTVALLAVSLLLCGLALAIVAIVVHPTLGSLKGGAIAFWLSAIVAILIGAAVGGWVAGRGRGSGALQGFLAWGLALIVTVGFQGFAFRGMLGAAVNTAVESAAVSFERTAATQAMVAEGDPAGSDPSRPPGDANDSMSRGDAAATGRTALHYVAGFGWSWFGTWFIAGIITVATAAAASRNRRSLAERLPEEGLHDRRLDRPTPAGPLTTAPTT